MVSIIMPAYNAEQYIAESIESIVKQIYQDWQLIIVNDGSTDDTDSICTKYKNQFPDKIVYVNESQNCGAAVALNKALEFAQGEFISWLSADDVYLPHFIEDAVSFLKHKKNYDAVICNINYIDENSNFIKKWDAPSLIGELLMPNSVEPYKSMLFYGNAFHGCSLLGKKEVFQLRFNKKYIYAPDYDYWLRVGAKYNIGYIEKLNLSCRIHPNQGTNLGKNEIDAIDVFIDNILCGDILKRYLQRLSLKQDEHIMECLFEGRIIKYMCNKNELKYLKRQIKEKYFDCCTKNGIKYVERIQSRLIGIINLLTDVSKVDNVCSGQELLKMLSDKIGADGIVLNIGGFRFDKYRMDKGALRVSRTFERNNNVVLVKISEEKIEEFMKTLSDDFVYVLNECDKQDILIGVSEYMIKNKLLRENTYIEMPKTDITFWGVAMDCMLDRIKH